jgi:hypothetical protein
MTVPAKPAGDLKKLAVEINRLHGEIIKLGQTAIEYAAEVGEMLIRAKGDCGGHGKWLPWLARECPDIPETTANLYMRIHRKYGELVAAAAAKGQRVADLTLRGAAKLLAAPKPTPNQDADLASSANTPEGPSLAADANPAPSLSAAPSPDLVAMLANADADELAQAIADAGWTEEQMARLLWLLNEAKGRLDRRPSRSRLPELVP